MATRKPKTKSAPETDKFQELLIVLDYMKYNMYLNAKATVFAAILAKSSSVRDAVFETNQTMQELDLATKEKQS